MTTEKPALSADAKARIKALVARYPHRRGALIPALWIAQEEFGWLSRETMQLVAPELDLPESWVFTTASFYTMLRKRPYGKYHLQICTNIACYLRGADDLVDMVKDVLGIDHLQTTEDGLFTLEKVQCLAACGYAPAMLVDKRDYFNVTVDELRERIVALQKEAHAVDGAPAAAPDVPAADVQAADGGAA